MVPWKLLAARRADLRAACPRPCARCHEHVHIRQYERWGALFVPAYLAASAWQGLRGGAPYRDNVFEREAYAASPISSMPGACAGMGKVK